MTYMEEIRRQLDRVRGLVDKITYKPGWKVCVTNELNYLYRSSTIFIHVDAMFSDLTNPDAPPVTISSQRGFPADMLVRMTDAEVIRHIIGRVVWELEEHEMHEWFRFSGSFVWDPHPEQSHAKHPAQLTAS